jgi:hypothetical protein
MSNRAGRYAMIGVFATSILVGGTVWLGSNGHPLSDSSRTAQDGNLLAIPPDSGPCGHPGKQTSLASAQAAVPYTLLVADELQTGDSLSDVIMCTSTEVLEEYASGIVADFDLNYDKTPDENLREFVADDPGEATLDTVLGSEAAVIAPVSGKAVGSDVRKGWIFHSDSR